MKQPTKPTKIRPLTKKQAAFVKHIINNPKDSNAEAAAQAYNLANRNTARVVAAQNLIKPNIRSALSNHVEVVEGAIYKTVHDWKDENNSRKREIAMQNAQWIHDKVFGRSKQQIDVTQTTLSLSIDLTGKGTPNKEDILSGESSPIPPL